MQAEQNPAQLPLRHFQADVARSDVEWYIDSVHNVCGVSICVEDWNRVRQLDAHGFIAGGGVDAWM